MNNPRPDQHLTLLNIFIPTFNQYQLFLKSLKSVSRIKRNFPELVDIIVVDDSSDQIISQRIEQYCCTKEINYIRSSSRNGPRSWNHYRSFQGTYTWILHHDEVFIGDCDELVQTLKHSMRRNAFILQSRSNTHCYRSFISAHLINQFPRLILYFNFIGAPSNVIFPTSLLLRFRHEFPLTTDVIFYYELASWSNLYFMPIKNCSTFTICNKKSIKQSLLSLNSRKQHLQEIILYCSKYHSKLNKIDLIASDLFSMLIKTLFKLSYLFSRNYS